MTLQDINELEIQAHYCDDYSQFKREMAEVARLRAEHTRANTKAFPSRNARQRVVLRTQEDVQRESRVAIRKALERLECR